MAVRRRGLIGSALATALMGSFLYRAGPTAGSPSGREEGQAGAALSTTTDPSKKQGNTKPTLAAKAKGPWIASQDHFAGRPPCFRGRSSVKQKNAGGNDLRQWCIPKCERVKAMLAVIPDPVQTHLALRFDRAIDTIELAAESMGSVLDRYWLPWDLDPKLDWIDYASFEAAKNDRDQKESEPGLLMFRWDKSEEPNPTLLYVFVVGETTTAGVNGDQFVKAVCYADLLNGGAGAPRPDSCRARHPGTNSLSSRGNAISTYILGPTSSGSAASLAALIRNYPRDKFVINATARSLDAIEAICPRLRQFSMFVTPVTEATRGLCKMLETDHAIDRGACQDIDSHQVAVLSEGSTTLGASVQDSDTFRYPREIASLRNAYGASGVQSSAATDKTGGRRPSLPVNLSDTTNRSDEPPDFSKLQSPLSQEAALMAFAAEIRRKHYRYIGINSSNTLDIVFLESFLRNAVPDVRLFSFESDLLLEHEPEDTSYIGTLSVLSYPLLYPPLNQVGNQSGEAALHAMRTHLPFTSQREEGLYNAAVCIVNEMVGNKTPNEPALGFLSERKACPEVSNPPLWLTVFGAGGHWPIEVHGPPETLDGVQGPDLKRLSLPATWIAVCVLLCVLAILHISILLGLAPFSAKFQPFRLSTVAPFRQLLGIHLASATLALALMLVVTSAWKSSLWMLIPKILVLFLILTCGALTCKYGCWRIKDRARLQQSRLLGSDSAKALFWVGILAFVLVWGGAVTFLYSWSTLGAIQDGHYGSFFSFRAANLASIVSPLAPMLPLLAAIYIAAIFYVWHLVFNDKIRPRLNPSWEKAPPSENELRPGCKSEKFIAKAINGDLKNAVWGVVILVAWAILFFWRSQFELFERPWFEWLYKILFCLVMWLILISGFRLALIWQMLRKFLLELNRQRARQVFSQLKNEGWRSLWFYGSEDPDWDSMSRSLEVLQQLWNMRRKLHAVQDVDMAIKEIRRTRRLLQDDAPFLDLKPFSVSDKDGKLEKAITRAQDVLAQALNQALDSLQEIWGGKIWDAHDRMIERRKLLEKYAALRWAEFIRAVIARIRLLILFLAVGFSLAMISLVIYAFEPHHELLWSVTAIFIGIGVLVVTVLAQIYSDPILSSIVGSKPGKLDFAFYVRLVAIGIGPFLTLLATHFPGIGRYVLSLVQPGLEAMK